MFVDANPKACSVIKANLEKSKLGFSAAVFNVDAKKYLQKAAKEGLKFDIIFLDPPYALGLLDEVLSFIEEHKLLNHEGLIVCEFDNGTNVDIKSYKLLKDKRYGRVCVNILETLA